MATLIYLYKRLTECFEKFTDVTSHEINQTQCLLKVSICAYIGMTLFSLMQLWMSIISDYSFTFWNGILQMVANFLLDTFTIGVTLCLNLQASRKHKLDKKRKEELRQAKIGIMLS